jgi:hypothetical protein
MTRTDDILRSKSQPCRLMQLLSENRNSSIRIQSLGEHFLIVESGKMKTPAMDKQIEEQALQMVRGRHSDLETVYLLSTKRNFLGGTLFQVGYNTTDGKPWYNYVLFVNDDYKFFPNNDDLVKGILNAESSDRIYTWILKPENVPGQIAILFTMTIIAIIFVNMFSAADTEVPEIMKSALTLILGYYFGKQSS